MAKEQGQAARKAAAAMAGALKAEAAASTAAAKGKASDDRKPEGAEKTGRKRSPDQLLRAAFAQASQVFGQVVSTMMQSPQHRHLLLSDLEWRVIPPIALQQYRLVQRNGTPAGFVSWALVSEAVEEQLQQPDFRLRPQDWKSGERVWIVDVVAPPQQAPVLIEKVKAELFKDREVKLRKGLVAEPRRRETSDGAKAPDSTESYEGTPVVGDVL